MKNGTKTRRLNPRHVPNSRSGIPRNSFQSEVFFSGFFYFRFKIVFFSLLLPSGSRSIFLPPHSKPPKSPSGRPDSGGRRVHSRPPDRRATMYRRRRVVSVPALLCLLVVAAVDGHSNGGRPAASHRRLRDEIFALIERPMRYYSDAAGADEMDVNMMLGVSVMAGNMVAVRRL